MPKDEFVTFRIFNDADAALELSALLEKNGIEYQNIDSSAGFDVTFANNAFNKEYRIKLRKEDFAQADKLLLDAAADDIENLDKDYYLFEFTDEELNEIVLNRAEWSPLDFLLAQKLLKERGKEVKPEVIQQIEKQKNEELAKPEKSQKDWISAGYILAILGGLLGIFIGYHLYSHKKTLPNGEQVYAYSEHDRKEGQKILIIGIIAFIICVIIKILRII